MNPLCVNYFVPGTGKSFGVTDFINPDELSEPVQQVFTPRNWSSAHRSLLVSCNSA
jgi:hypothetical protein